MIKQDEIAECLQRASNLNNFLARLTDQNRSVSISRRPLRRGTRHYKQIRSHAADLYEILDAKFPTPPNCRCALNHEVNIRLDIRSARTTTKGFYFHLAFTFEQAHYQEATPSVCSWREMHVQPYDLVADHCVVSHTADANTPQKRVQFCLEGASEPAYQEISDLCTTIGERQDSNDWFGVVVSCGKRHRLRAVKADQVLSETFTRPQTVSLSEVLCDKTFRREHRSRLGLKLASSVMQLHTTQWLSDHWGSDDIHFVRSAGVVNFEHPLVRRGFGSNKQKAAMLNSRALSRSIPCLFSLAIVLIELWYYESIKNLQSESEASQVCSSIL
jgi:hypothetical protein